MSDASTGLTQTRLKPGVDSVYPDLSRLDLPLARLRGETH